MADHDVEIPFHLRDAYAVAGAIPPFTRKVSPRGGARLDFIWVSNGLNIAGVLRPLPLEYREVVHRLGLPNYVLPSDHLPVGAVLGLSRVSSQQAEHSHSE